MEIKKVIFLNLYFIQNFTTFFFTFCVNFFSSCFVFTKIVYALNTCTLMNTNYIIRQTTDIGFILVQTNTSVASRQYKTLFFFFFLILYVYFTSFSPLKQLTSTLCTLYVYIDLFVVRCNQIFFYPILSKNLHKITIRLNQI